MIKRGSNLDNKVCKVLVLKFYGKEKVDLAYELMLGQVNNKVKFSIEIYNALIHGRCRIGRIAKAQTIKKLKKRYVCESDLALLMICC